MSKNDSKTFDPTPGEDFYEENFFPVETDYWERARQFAQEREDEFFNADIALNETRRRFLDGDPEVPAEDVRIAELNVERAQRLHEIAREPLEWLETRRHKDDYSRRTNGMPSALWRRKLRLRHVEGKLAERLTVDYLRNIQARKDAHESNVRRLQLRYENKVRELEEKVTKGKLTQAQAQAQADEEAKIRDAEIAAENASWDAENAKRDETLTKLRDEKRELTAWLDRYDPAAKAPKIIRK
ncbi:hypothetical protein ACIOWF_05150 [Cellulosimicrobium cellulans]|uniref:hypothetical protein n=1 Tax=Cellulosimicrobium cellulans TaxID=1710 RepID=UPI00382C583D